MINQSKQESLELDLQTLIDESLKNVSNVSMSKGIEIAVTGNISPRSVNMSKKSIGLINQTIITFLKAIEFEKLDIVLEKNEIVLYAKNWNKLLSPLYKTNVFNYMNYLEQKDRVKFFMNKKISENSCLCLGIKFE